MCWRAAGARRWCGPARGRVCPCDGPLASAGATHSRMGGSSCLGVLTGVPGPGQSPTVPRRHLAVLERSVGAGCLGRPSLFSCQAARPDLAIGTATASGGRGRRSGRAGRGEEGWHVDPDSGAHRTGNREALEVVALRPGRLGPVDRVEQGGQVLGESLLAEARLAERDVNDPALVDLELDPAALDLAQGTITF